MIIDSSVIIAFLKKEAEHENISLILSDKTQIKLISAATYLEITSVIDRVEKKSGKYFDELISKSNIIIEPFTFEQAKIARIAYQQYGKGSGHKAHLILVIVFLTLLQKKKTKHYSLRVMILYTLT